MDNRQFGFSGIIIQLGWGGRKINGLQIANPPNRTDTGVNFLLLADGYEVVCL
jgi:hypothetical protein